MGKLKGKRTIIGGILMSLIGLVWNLDQLVDGTWLTTEQYEAIGLFVGGLTGVALRLGVASK